VVVVEKPFPQEARVIITIPQLLGDFKQTLPQWPNSGPISPKEIYLKKRSPLLQSLTSPDP